MYKNGFGIKSSTMVGFYDPTKLNGKKIKSIQKYFNFKCINCIENYLPTRQTKLDWYFTVT